LSIIENIRRNTGDLLIPIIDLHAQYMSIKDKIDKAISGVVESGFFILGENVRKFESEFSKYCSVNHGAGVASGTDALKIALLACGVRYGDEVITTPLSAIATSFSITHIGATPVFVDVDETYNIDVNKIEENINKKTKAILPVHLYGNPCDMDVILEIAKKHDLKVIEDASQAHGAEYKGKKVGGLADAAAFSFYPTKNLGCYGDGGIILTNDEEIAERAFLLRNYGQTKRYEHTIRGFNSRLDEIQAAVLLVKLKHLDEWNDARRKNAKLYIKLLDGSTVITPIEREYVKHVYHQFVIRTEQRDKLKKFLESNGVLTDIHYPKPIYMQKAYADLGIKSMPIVEGFTKKILSLPIYPELKKEQIETIVRLIKLK